MSVNTHERRVEEYSQRELKFPLLTAPALMAMIGLVVQKCVNWTVPNVDIQMLGMALALIGAGLFVISLLTRFKDAQSAQADFTTAWIMPVIFFAVGIVIKYVITANWLHFDRALAGEVIMWVSAVWFILAFLLHYVIPKTSDRTPKRIVKESKTAVAHEDPTDESYGEDRYLNEKFNQGNPNHMFQGNTAPAHDERRDAMANPNHQYSQSDTYPDSADEYVVDEAPTATMNTVRPGTEESRKQTVRRLEDDRTGNLNR